MALFSRPIRGRLEIAHLKTCLSEFDQDELFQSEVPLKNGQMMDLYSAVTPKTVQRHFDWMQEHNIDGVFLQHFLTGSNINKFNGNQWLFYENTIHSYQRN